MTHDAYKQLIETLEEEIRALSHLAQVDAHIAANAAKFSTVELKSASFDRERWVGQLEVLAGRRLRQLQVIAGNSAPSRHLSDVIRSAPAEWVASLKATHAKLGSVAQDALNARAAAGSALNIAMNATGAKLRFLAAATGERPRTSRIETDV